MPLYNPPVSGGGSTEYGPAAPAIGVTNVYSMAPANITGAVSTAGISALRFYMLPVWWPGGTTSAITFNIVTASAAGKVIRYGLYNMKANGTPGTLVQELTSGSTVPADVTAQTVGTITQTLAAGWYFLAIVSDGAPSLTGNFSGSAALGLSWSGSTFINVAWLFRTLGALAAFGDESASTWSVNGSGTVAPMMGLK